MDDLASDNPLPRSIFIAAFILSRAPYGRAFSALLVTVAAACGPDSAGPLPHLGAEVPVESALATGQIVMNEIELAAVARPAIIPHADREHWPPVYDFRSEPLGVEASMQVWGAIGMKTFGLEVEEGDQPTFRLLAEGPEGKTVLFEKTGTVDFPPDEWLPSRVTVPTEIGSHVTLRFTITHSPKLERGAPRTLGIWAVPRVLRPAHTDLPNVLLVVLDTLRADRTGLYGYKRDTTPFLDRLATRGVTVADMITPYPSTLTSHWSLLTGLSPPHHGAYPKADVRPEATTLSEVLKAAGYLTVAFTEGGYVHSLFGFGRGFDLYHNGSTKGLQDFPGTAEATFGLAVDWLTQHKDSRFFLFLHTYQVHAPYNPPAEYLAKFETGYSGRWASSYPAKAAFSINNRETSVRPQEIAHLGAMYDAEIRHLDDSLEDLWDLLQALGVLDDTLVLITSDHGEDLLEHGWLHHGTTLYDPALRVPLLMIWPERIPEARRLECQRSLVDLMPTILTLLGLELPTTIDGRSFAEELRGGICSESRPAYSELRDSFHKGRGDRPIASVRDGEWKFIAHQSPGAAELFHLTPDPGESQNLIASGKERAELMSAALDAYVQGAPEAFEPRGELSPEVEEQLRGLGYLE